MLANDLHVGDHLWAKTGGWRAIKAVMTIAPFPARKYPGRVSVVLDNGDHLRFTWHEVVHTATEFSGEF